ncbi:WD40 repeat-like protein [Fistulina hepatica ATCC 64428]|uniref:WD40 repeat-like protein n=1 Tax=Fistulina hepatica ATCC 64428 TaxID=1128425 RepID=A0A0D7AQR9_9AGAR|nr:WD40 repeat-like protein [Fistulina hepatica ATCC 64428]
MATTSSVTSHPVFFTTQTPYPLPSQKYMLPATWKRYQLSQLINKALSLPKPVPFDFLVRGQVLRTSIGDWCAENGVVEEETLELEYIQSVMPPERMSDIPHDDWVSSVSCQIPGTFYTASYDGHVRAFDYSQKMKWIYHAHSAPITSLCVVSRTENDGPSLIATSSHDLTAQILRITDNEKIEPLASLHLHTSTVSSVCSNAAGSHLLTASWDALLALWDTSIPASDEVPEDGERIKRRRKDPGAPKRKAPLTVLKSHSARISRAVFDPQHAVRAYSCGFDSTVRQWDVENGLCTHTITASEKPFLDMALSADGNTALAASTDRTVCVYDVRDAKANAIRASIASLSHSDTPSCVATGAEVHQVLTGAYDGVVRLWDLRSVKSAMTSFRVWDGKQKILTLDWQRGMVAVGGEGGFEVWRADGER